MATYKTPGVYIEEISVLPPSIAEVETAIPAFMGFTQSGSKNVPVRINSLVDYQLYFGSAKLEKGITVSVKDGTVTTVSVDVKNQSKYVMFYAMQLYFANGGGPCYMISAGSFEEGESASINDYKDCLDAVEKEDEPTLLVFPDAPYILGDNYYVLMTTALKQCQKLGDRFLIMDVLDKDKSVSASVTAFRQISADTDFAKYGAAYYPYLNTTIPYAYDENSFNITGADSTKNAAAPKIAEVVEPKEGDAEAKAAKKAVPVSTTTDFSSLSNAVQNQIKQKINAVGVQLTPCAAVAGIYANVDSTRGVWKAPANVSLNYVTSVTVKITDDDQDDMNIDVNAGKSVNAIRSFVGKGTKIWGARTLAGNDNEWRYINVRRFFNMVEESVKKSTSWAVFEPNDMNTWVKVRAMIENYLLLKWKDGALAGAKPNDAFFVRVGLGLTMTAQDVLEGRMNIEIGLAAVRPAEFIILKFSHLIQKS
jgi:phage tail sheath protein FI